MANTQTTIIIIFRKVRVFKRYTQFRYGNFDFEIVSKLPDLGIVFITGDAFTEAQQASSGQALKAIFTLNKYMENLSV